MSAKTVFNPWRFLSPDLRDRIKATGVDYSQRYASNIASDLEMMGEYELSREMLGQVQEVLDTKEAAAERRRNGMPPL